MQSPELQSGKRVVVNYRAVWSRFDHPTIPLARGEGRRRLKSVAAAKLDGRACGVEIHTRTTVLGQLGHGVTRTWPLAVKKMSEKVVAAGHRRPATCVT